jgi:hypothetical protein
VMQSPWWIETHWGRAFDIISLARDGFPGNALQGHGTVLMRKPVTRVTSEMLCAIDRRESRELSALAHNVRQLLDETAALRNDRAHLVAELAQAGDRRGQIERQLCDADRRLDTMVRSRSWRATRPLRKLAARVRTATGPGKIA